MFGAYISNVSSSVSWGDNSTCTITIVEDPENDVFASIPSPGTPAYISLGSFYFGGILQRWTYNESLSGRTYDVILESPAKLLDGVQVILSDFNGSIVTEDTRYEPYNYGIFSNQLQNIYNVFAYWENPTVGNGGYGSSNSNSAGMPANKVLTTLQQLTNGGGPFGNRMNLGGHLYSLDLSELSSYISDNFRLQGPVQSVTSIIQECCELAGLDYMVELRGRTIKIRTISRGSVPNANAVANLVNSWQNSGLLISKQIGKEFAAPVTQKLAVGGPVSRLLVQDATTTFPVWGKLANSQYIVDTNINTVTAYSNPAASVPVLLDEYSGSINYTASVMELRMATGGKDTWEAFKAFETMYGVERNGYNDPASSPWYSKIGADINIFNALSEGRFTSFDLTNTSYATAIKRNSGYLDFTKDKIWSAVNRVASEFYGQVFFMRLDTYEPGGESGNVRWVTDEYVKQHVWDITDSAWDPRPLFQDPAFYDAEGRVKGGCAWPTDTRFDYSALGSDWTTTSDGGIATTKGGADKEIYYIDGQPYVIVRSGGAVLSYDGITTPDFGLTVLVWYFTGQFIHPALYMTSGTNNVQISIPPLVVPPYSYGVPQQSTTYSWGPWWAWSGNGDSVGLSECVFDAELRPEVFGSSAALDQAGYAAATAGLARSSFQETGQVEVVGMPFANVGDMLGGGPYINGISINVGVDQTSTTYTFSSWTPEFGKLSQVNIARMKKIRKGALALVQSNRAKVTKQQFPKRPFNKSSMAQLSAAQGTTARPNITMIHGFFSDVVGQATGQSGLSGDPQSYNIGQ
jgi:hypothetical protein